jgi:ATP-dependent Clp protease ATP-binding subunit ClpA
MPLSMEGAIASLCGHVAIEEAEALAEWLRATPDAVVNLSACEALHSAVLQVLLVALPRCAAPPPDQVLAALLFILPAEVPA